MCSKRALGLLSCFVLSATVAVGCKSSDEPTQSGNGGASVGGSSSSGGASGSGGAVGSGGASSQGGKPGSGGANAGGTTTNGGSSGSGGASSKPDAATGSGGSVAGDAAVSSGGSGAGGAKTGGAGGGTTGSATGGSTSGTNPSGGSPAGGSTGAGGAGGGGTCPAVAGLDSATFDAGKSPTEIGKLGTSYFMKNQLQSGLDNYGGDGYAWTFGYVGSLMFTKVIGDAANNKTLIDKLNCSTFSAPTGTDVDQRAFGDLPLEIFLQNANAACKTLGLSLADAQWKNTTSDGISTEARYWIDDMYMITGLQVWAYRATKDQKYLDRAAKTMVAYIAALQKDNDTKTTGLFWHTKKSHAYWSRANGWFAAGATELLLELPAGHTNRDAIMAAWKKQMDALITLQFPSGNDQGCWHQVLDVTTNAASYAESSSSAMFTFALVTGLKNGWLSGDKYVTAALNGWKCISNKTDSSGLLTKVCTGTGEPTATDLAGQQQFYFDRPAPAGDRHGQGPLLWAATAMLRKDCPGLR